MTGNKDQNVTDLLARRNMNIDIKIYQISKLSYVFRICHHSRIIKEQISISYDKDQAAKKAVEILRKWLTDDKRA